MQLLGIELGPLEEQPVLITAEPSLQPMCVIFKTWSHCVRPDWPGTQDGLKLKKNPPPLPPEPWDDLCEESHPA